MKLSIVVAGALAPVAHSCGVLVHNLVVQRASYLFSLPSPAQSHTVISSLLTNPAYYPSIQAGAFFPDWGYKCFPTTDAHSEAAHWPPFLVAAAEYITETYGHLTAQRSPAEQAHFESLLAFIFAAASHQVADATWHGIRLPTGLMAALAAVDFGGDYYKAHTAQDFGADFIHAARMGRLSGDANDWVANMWTVPVEDIMKIYERLDRKFSRLLFRHCMSRGLAGLRSELVIGEELMPIYADTVPMLLDEVDDYYLGGIKEMGARTVGCWLNLTEWFVDGGGDRKRDDNGWGLCDVFQAIAGRGGAGEDNHRTNFLDQPRLASQLDEELRNFEVSVDAFGAETYIFPLLHLSKPSKAAGDDDYPTGDPTYVSAYVPYSHMGTTLALGDFFFQSTPGDVDHPLAVAVGSPFTSEFANVPHEGDLLVIPLDVISPFSSSSSATVPTSESNINHTYSSNTIPTTFKIDQRFSTSLTPLNLPHLNSSDFPDLPSTLLAISSPGPLTYDPDSAPNPPFSSLSPAGKVEIYVPHSSPEYRKPLISIAATGADLGGIGGRQFGTSLSSGALDPSKPDEDWLIISSPRSDNIRVCDNGRETIQLGEGEVTVIRILSDLSTEAYDIKLPAAVKHQLPCPDPGSTYMGYERFGFSTAVVNATLFVAAPGIDTVFAFQFHDDDEDAEDTRSDDTHESARHTGFRFVGQLKAPMASKSFGQTLAASITHSGKPMLAVSAPNEEVDGVVQAGVVRGYDVLFSERKTHHQQQQQHRELRQNREHPLDRKDDDSSHSVLFAPAVTLRASTSLLKKYTKFGRSMKFAPGEEKSSLWIGSGWALKERGAVWEVDLRSLKLGDHAVDVPVKWVGKEAMGRFGEAIEVTKNGDVVVGIPGSGSGKPVEERMHGGIAVFFAAVDEDRVKGDGIVVDDGTSEL